MTKTGFKHRFSETINRLGRGISCVQSRAMRDCDKDCEAPTFKPSEIAGSKVVKGSDTYIAVDCLSEKEEKEILNSFQPQRIRRSISFTGLSVREAERLRSIAEGHSLSLVQNNSVVTDLRRGRCHSFAGVKNKKLVEITQGLHETAVVDGLLTTTFCSTEL